MNRHACVLLSLIVAAHASSLLAAEASAPGEADLIGRFDLAVPDVPAANVLGLSADTVIRPAVGKDFAASLLNGVGKDGNLQAGIAIDVRPALFIAQERFSLSNYRETTLEDAGTPYERYRMKKGAYWTKLRLSFATGRADGGTGDADRHAIGLNWNIFDHGDSRLSPAYRECVAVPMRNVHNALTPLLISGASEEALKTAGEAAEAAGAKLVQKCAKEFEASHWNADSWDVGMAYFDFNAPGAESNGYAAWTTYARHLGRQGQLILHGRYHDGEVAPDPTDKTKSVIQDALILGARVRWLAPGGAFLLEVSRNDVDRESGNDDKFTLGSVGYEIRIAEGFWVQLAYGKAYGTDSKDDDPVFSGQFRWGYTEKSTLK